MSIEVKVRGLSGVNGSLADAIQALTPNAQRNNFRRIMDLALRDTKEHTPGSGTLRAGWTLQSTFTSSRDGFRFFGRIFNRQAQRRLFYVSCSDGKTRPKLDAQDRQQTYADIIPILDAGSRPHRIAPRRYGFLAFSVRNRLDSRVGRFRDNRGRFATQSSCVFTRGTVFHPGTKAYRTLSSPRQKLLTLARTAVLESGEQIIKPF